MRETQQWRLVRLQRRLRSGRVVKVRVSATVFADTLGTMREWLDRNSVIPVRFEHATERNENVLILVEFEESNLADAFRREFGDDIGGGRPARRPIRQRSRGGFAAKRAAPVLGPGSSRKCLPKCSSAPNAQDL